jgi:putative Mn2+ efflux pump MntP
MKKGIAVSASIDIGQNVTSLIEKLAHQIGTTVDKVFPWYVKQQVMEGWMYIITAVLAILLGWMMFAISFKKADFDEGNRYIAPAITGLILLAFGCVFLLSGLSSSVTKICNPEYHALTAMTADMVKLLH